MNEARPTGDGGATSSGVALPEHPAQAGSENPPHHAWRYVTREGREVELVNLRAAPLPGFVIGTRRDTGEEWTVAVGKLTESGKRKAES